MHKQFDELLKSLAEGVSRREALKKFVVGPAGDTRLKSHQSAIVVVALLATGTVARANTLTVTNTNDKGSGSFRATTNSAKSGDTIVFASSLNGQTITLTSDQITIKNSVDIEGPGAALLSVSGNDKNRIFNINGGLTVTIAGLAITHGYANGGAGVLNAGSTLTLAGDVVAYSQAFHLESDVGNGGGVRNSNGGNLVAKNCLFLGNTALGDRSANLEAEGGGLYNAHDSTASVTDCDFTGNQAFGGDGAVASKGFPSGFQGQAEGGAVHNAGTLIVEHCTFTNNLAKGGNGAKADSSAGVGLQMAFGTGGAIENHGGTITVSDSAFTNNQAIGGSNELGGGGPGSLWGQGAGGAITNGTTATITNCTFTGNEARGGSGSTCTGSLFAGVATGGAIFSIFTGATTTVSGCTFTNNLADGGSGNSGATYSGTGFGGGIFSQQGAVATVTSSTFTGNVAVGGPGPFGGAGGDGLGGGFANILASNLTVKTSVVSGNRAIGGAAGTLGSPGNGFGGGFYLTSDGVACWDSFTSVSTSGNFASTGFPDVFGTFTICP